MRTVTLVGCSIGIFMAGCVTEVEVGEMAQSVISPNGISPNGISPNGISPNGISPNGISPNGAVLNGISPNGISPNGGSLTAATTTAPLVGAELVGSAWTGVLSDSSTVALRIDAAKPGEGANADVWSYVFSFEREGAWYPLCVDANGAPAYADTVGGVWSYAQGVPGGGAYNAASSSFTIACRGSAISKCVELGYKPWLGEAARLGACVRALRADYCGDGTPHTVNGTLVNLYDGAGIQPDAAEWVVEAEWTPAGARCFAAEASTRYFRTGTGTPSCVPALLAPDPSCGQGFAAGASLITELVPLE